MESCSISVIDSKVFGLIGNIPADYHSADLRNYFSQVIETNCIDCFHFRHRPEGKLINESDPTSKTSSEQRQFNQGNSESSKCGTTCCIIRCKQSKLKETIRMYHRKHWLDRNGESLPTLCFISKIKIRPTGKNSIFLKPKGALPIHRKLDESYPCKLVPATRRTRNSGLPSRTLSSRMFAKSYPRQVVP